MNNISKRWAEHNPFNCDMRKTARKRFLAEKYGQRQKENFKITLYGFLKLIESDFKVWGLIDTFKGLKRRHRALKTILVLRFPDARNILTLRIS